MSEYYVEKQNWQHWPKVLVMCRISGRMENGNVAVERRRYVPEDKDDYQRKRELNRRNKANNDLIEQNMLMSAVTGKQQERIADLESLVRYMEPWITGSVRNLVLRKMADLGIEVEE